MFQKKLHRYSALSLSLLLGVTSGIYAGGLKKSGPHISGKDMRADKQLNAALRRQHERESNAQTTLSAADFAKIVAAQQRANARQPINVQLAAPQLKALLILAALGVTSNLILPACAYESDLAKEVQRRANNCNSFWPNGDPEYSRCMAEILSDVKSIL